MNPLGKWWSRLFLWCGRRSPQVTAGQHRLPAMWSPNNSPRSSQATKTCWITGLTTTLLRGFSAVGCLRLFRSIQNGSGNQFWKFPQKSCFQLDKCYRLSKFVVLCWNLTNSTAHLCSTQERWSENDFLYKIDKMSLFLWVTFKILCTGLLVHYSRPASV